MVSSTSFDFLASSSACTLELDLIGAAGCFFPSLISATLDGLDVRGVDELLEELLSAYVGFSSIKAH